MPKLILKSPYIKCGGKGGIGGGGYLRYIGTRDGVELVPDDRPATKRQEQLIRSLVRDFPDSKDLLEYADWEASRTKVHASAFITTALECNWEQANRSDVYLKYIATRPRVERLGSHGLFGDDDSVDLQRAAAELDSYTGNVWTHIISLKREDAARLGYDHAPAWRDLLRQERNEIAVAMGIPPDHFRWYAAFHDEGDHPHVHMVGSTKQEKTRSDMPFGEWLDFWYQNYVRPGLRPTTQTNYEWRIYRHIIPELGKIPLNQLGQKELQQFYTRLKKGGRLVHRGRFGEGLSDSMVRGCHVTCRAALEKAVREGLLRTNPAAGCKLPPKRGREMQVLGREELQRFLLQAQAEGCFELFLLDLCTGLRRGELLALQWDDLDFETGELTVEKQVYAVKGQLQLSVPKTRASIRKLVLPPEVVEVLREYRRGVDSRWMFPSPIKEGVPLSPGAARRRLQQILERAGCKHIRFHDLRHIFATMSLENGMDVKTLSAMLGHVSAATTLDIYAHITDTMQAEAAVRIDRGLGNAVEEAGRAEELQMTDFRPVEGRIRRPGTGCITEINDHLFEGRYSPTWPDGKRRARNVYAKTRAECEEKLDTLIREMQTERKLLLDQARGIVPPSTLTQKQKQIWEYMKLHPKETNLSAIARGAGVNRHTAAKHYEVIREIVGYG